MAFLTRIQGASSTSILSQTSQFGSNSPSVEIADSNFGWTDGINPQIIKAPVLTYTQSLSTGWSGNVGFPSTASSSGSPAWNTPSNAFLPDGSYTTCTTTGWLTQGGLLILSNFGFNIPAGTTITSVEVTYQGYYTSTNGVTPSYDTGFGFVKNTANILSFSGSSLWSGLTTTNSTQVQTFSPSSFSDNGTSLSSFTVDELNSPTFGMVVYGAGTVDNASTGGDINTFIDYVNVRLLYNTPVLASVMSSTQTLLSPSVVNNSVVTSSVITSTQTLQTPTINAKSVFNASVLSFSETLQTPIVNTTSNTIIGATALSFSETLQTPMVNAKTLFSSSLMSFSETLQTPIVNTNIVTIVNATALSFSETLQPPSQYNLVDTGLVYPFKPITQDAVGTFSWSNPDRANNNDGNYASVTTTSTGSTTRLIINAEDFGVPTLSSVEVTSLDIYVWRRRTGTSAYNWFTQFLNDGTGVGAGGTNSYGEDSVGSGVWGWQTLSVGFDFSVLSTINATNRLGNNFNKLDLAFWVQNAAGTTTCDVDYFKVQVKYKDFVGNTFQASKLIFTQTLPAPVTVVDATALSFSQTLQTPTVNARDRFTASSLSFTETLPLATARVLINVSATPLSFNEALPNPFTFVYNKNNQPQITFWGV
jgi:hypothetical protein